MAIQGNAELFLVNRLTDWVIEDLIRGLERTQSNLTGGNRLFGGRLYIRRRGLENQNKPEQYHNLILFQDKIPVKTKRSEQSRGRLNLIPLQSDAVSTKRGMNRRGTLPTAPH